VPPEFKTAILSRAKFVCVSKLKYSLLYPCVSQDINIAIPHDRPSNTREGLPTFNLNLKDARLKPQKTLIFNRPKLKPLCVCVFFRNVMGVPKVRNEHFVKSRITRQ